MRFIVWSPCYKSGLKQQQKRLIKKYLWAGIPICPTAKVESGAYFDTQLNNHLITYRQTN